MSAALSHASLCESVVDSTPVAVIFTDREGTVRLWNHAAEVMFGWTAEETLGKSMDMMVPDKHKAKHWGGYDRVMQTGATKYGREVLSVPALTKDGRRISIEFNIALVKDSDGRVLGAAATINDVTARWERDKALRTRLNELETKLKQLEGTAKAAGH